MRIIAGQYRRRKIKGPGDKDPARPIPDFVKESLFNLLRGHTEGQAVLDVFAGTGAIGLEAVSRGATNCVFVERDRGMLRLLDDNIEHVGAGDACRVVKTDALGAGTINACPKPVHLIFLDPPYPMARTPEGWDRIRTQMSRLGAHLDDTGYLVVRTPWPFAHALDPETNRPIGEEQATDDERGSKKRSKDKTRTGRHPELGFRDDEGDMVVEIDAEQFMMNEAQEPDSAPEPKPKKTKPIYVEPDTHVQGMIGPETHDYGTTAIHLYMRDPDGPDADSSADHSNTQSDQPA